MSVRAFAFGSLAMAGAWFSFAWILPALGKSVLTLMGR